ncbi:unnamed protein product [Rangifer tarandus platyrhynchus]|uniref:Uncharacterized protein n=2 Tax=Rangifer tarandus platyrhynchus TaxID=3082113 RepID=A0ABN8YDQ1_RANTA|nr:unnamed protein product [Rangifer tarandus platyrhynchus]
MVCTLGPHLPQPTCLSFFCPRGPFQALGLRPLDNLVLFAHPPNQEQTPPWPPQPPCPPHPIPEARTWFSIEVGVGTPKGPLPWPFASPGEAGTPPHPKPRPQFTFHCWEKKEAGAQSVCAPRTKDPGGQSGARVEKLAAPFYKYYT